MDKYTPEEIAWLNSQGYTPEQAEYLQGMMVYGLIGWAVKWVIIGVLLLVLVAKAVC